ncbi:beta-hydroxyacyl-ACP dehydratase [Nocardia panacis]|uniref:Beta-hydroxyacyl-ACP dehydratase n=1 Tax=Nocardia panacis TaxID=2340916 RepID=A0A3A4K2N3_9NOCA|nr:beta-hydroxyacyl-ACP dehydratase [Nocardia panacis]RJO78948.1 beta-hydroxyacyl-ACP dehydratase [Nocardia panacis]
MYDQTEIQEILPHRHPILLIDRVDDITFFECLVAVKAVTCAEPCYRTVPETALSADFAYPRSLIIESFCQSCAFLWLASIRSVNAKPNGRLVFATAKDVVFHQHAFPGDLLRHTVRMTRMVGDNAFLTGEIWIGDRLVAEVGAIAAALRPTTTLEGSEQSMQN